jgi:ATP-binding cassette, subfamily B, multidrug efflux pump
VLYVERFFEPIRELAQRYNTFQATMAASERIFNLLDNQPDLTDAPVPTRCRPSRARVDFEHVEFGYHDEEPVLHDINLHVEPGQRIALVGETGAGKSTIIRLSGRFFEIDGGSLRIDGHDVRQVTRASLRRQLGIVLQDTFLFSGTIADNIRYGRLDASDAEVEAGHACRRRARLHHARAAGLCHGGRVKTGSTSASGSARWSALPVHSSPIRAS